MRTLILAAVMMMGVTMSAQQKDVKREPLKPEQRAELASKKLALELNLNEKQQKDVQKLFLEKSKKAEQAKAQRKADKEAGKKPNADERYAMMNKRLDSQIAMKAEMKKILTAEQFTKWETMKKGNHGKITKGRKNFKKAHRR